MQFFPVQFGMLSIGDETASVSVKIDKADLSLDRAEELFCGRRLRVCCAIGEASRAHPEQMEFIDVSGEKFVALVDVRGYSSKPKFFSASLRFTLGSNKPEQLSPIARQKGHLVVLEVLEAIGHEDDEDDRDIEREFSEDGEEDDGEDTAKLATEHDDEAKVAVPEGKTLIDGTVAGEDPTKSGEEWAKCSIRDCKKFGLTPALIEKIEAKGVKTMGMLANLIGGRVSGCPAGVVDVDGIGPKSVDKVEDAYHAWIAANQDKFKPAPEPEEPASQESEPENEETESEATDVDPQDEPQVAVPYSQGGPIPRAPEEDGFDLDEREQDSEEDADASDIPTG